jgi:hypothetical protein
VPGPLAGGAGTFSTGTIEPGTDAGADIGAE